MQDIHRVLGALRRPPLLVRAARLGASAYNRGASLPRLIGPGPLPAPAGALARLIEIERAQDTARRDGAATWRAADHVAVLIAVMGEARLLDRQAQENASGIASLRRATKSPSASLIAGSSAGCW
ncbi:DUF6477 family protein [Roseovarius ramblicola]|uniref:DUF6477 family protein n=1 Tax=Roseovarius ramblicola TaxID=2022336 RepID=A0ABV5I1F4_9RHOB